MFAAITYKRPLNFVILVNVIAYLILYFYKTPYDYHILLAGLAVVTLLTSVYYFIILRDLGDEYIFLIVSMLCSIGIIVVYRLNQKMGYRQIVWFAIGIGLFLASYYIFIWVKNWSKYIYYYVALSFVIYLFTLIFGKNINGARNWIMIGGHSFQLSELTKILFLFFMACYFKSINSALIKLPDNISIKPSVVNRIVLISVSLMNMLFLILQKEWGTATLFFIVYLVLLYVYDTSIVFLIINLAATIPIAIGSYFYMYHIRVRVDNWLNPWADAAGKGYQMIQSLIAISEGGFFGTGIGLGKPDLVPAVYTDFIFSAICEEMGIFTGIAVILLYFILCYRGIKIVINVKKKFNKILALGITIMFGVQTFIIIGGVTKFIPLTGITLPFVSYGGSSIIASFIMMGLLQAVSKTSNDFEEGEVDEG